MVVTSFITMSRNVADSAKEIYPLKSIWKEIDSEPQNELLLYVQLILNKCLKDLA